MFVISSCGWRPSEQYLAMYTYLQEDYSQIPISEEPDYSITFYVDAPHLDYTSTLGLIQTIERHPNGSRHRDVGHAWINLKGIVDDKTFMFEGGHSGELGVIQPKYFDGVMNYIDEAMERNPIKYLWSTQYDGFFQAGSGGHTATFALQCPITEEEFFKILNFIQTGNYNFCEYSLTHHQCCTFVAQIAALIDLKLEYQMTMKIDQDICFGGRKIRLWEDPQYAIFTFGSPDLLERSLILPQSHRGTENGECIRKKY